MSFDPLKLLARPPIETRHELTRSDTMLYALGVGAGNSPNDLDFVYEERLKALPTMAVVMAYPGFIWRNPELGANWKKLLHGEQLLELFAPLPVEGALHSETTFESVHDKGADKGAIVYSTRRLFDDNGTHLATDTRSSFLRGNGGCGTPDSNKSPAPNPHPMPEGEPDIVVDLPTAGNQAMIYRLSGDHNPLHIDPKVATTAGFKQPVLHGLCTYGVVGRALLSAAAENDVTRIKKLNVRFSAPVYPGETIRTEIWREPVLRERVLSERVLSERVLSEHSESFAFRAQVVERGIVVINNGYCEVS